MPKMLRNPRVALFALVVVCVAVASSVGLTRAQPVEKNQKVRPYQFGFTIDEQQHRFEKQDERGIVMGEFGFITADGIYHVTVYATDEEGKFRILAMKSYPYESPPKAIDMVVKPKAEPLPTTRTTTPLPKFNGNAKACSGCFIPKEGAKSVQSTSSKTAIRTLSKSLPAENGSKGRLPGFINPSFSNTAKTQTTNKALPTSTESAGAAPKTAPVNAQKAATASSGGTQQTTMQNSRSGNGSGKFGGNDSENNRGGGSTNNNGRGPSGSGNIGGQPGSKPPSSATDAGDLYRFKYLLDYNGHTETGARNGNKQGSFFAIGDDNVQRTVEYIANEFGFQPRISWRKLDSGTKLPLENSLKDYEFVWFRKDE